MALQGSGQIALSDIAEEFGGSSDIAMSDFYSAAAGIPASGAISFKNFYGKSAQFDLAISSNVNDYNIYDEATSAGFGGTGKVVLTIDSGIQ